MQQPSTDIDIMSLLKSGAHFGHRISRWHPNMKPYIYTTRNDVHIINLEKTQQLLNEALKAIREVITQGQQILFVGTKRQATTPLQKAAEIAEEPYVINRWFGGTLTNFKTISNRVGYMKNLEKQFETGEIQKYTKREQMLRKKELEDLQMKFEGIRNLQKVPGMLFAIDILKDDIAIQEAKKLSIPIVALADTNTNPNAVNYPIPCNDDAIKVLELVTSHIANDIKNAKEQRNAQKPKETSK